jgi:hypothetical protein
MKLIKESSGNMVIVTTKGVQFVFDFDSEVGYKTSRAIMEQLVNEKAITQYDTEEEVVQDLVGAISTLQQWEDDVVTMVAKHYYSVLIEMLDDGEIDLIDFSILIGKFTIDELNNRWL